MTDSSIASLNASVISDSSVLMTRELSYITFPLPSEVELTTNSVIIFEVYIELGTEDLFQALSQSLMYCIFGTNEDIFEENLIEIGLFPLQLDTNTFSYLIPNYLGDKNYLHLASLLPANVEFAVIGDIIVKEKVPVQGHIIEVDGEEIELLEQILDYDIPLFGPKTTSISNAFVDNSIIVEEGYGLFIFQNDFPSNCTTHLSFYGAVLDNVLEPFKGGMVGFLSQEYLNTTIEDPY